MTKKHNSVDVLSICTALCIDDEDPSKPLQSNRLTHLQERLLKKLGPNAYPFYFEVSSDSVCRWSVCEPTLKGLLIFRPLKFCIKFRNYA